MEMETVGSAAENDEGYLTSRVASLEAEAARQEKDALAVYGMLEGQDPHIAPLRRALAVWGLTVDDIGVLSIHGTSTKANVRQFLTSFPFADLPVRRRMRHTSGMRSSLSSRGQQEMLSRLSLRRVSSATPKVVPLLGSCAVFSNLSTLVLFLVTGTASTYLF
jgi:hypothetical protein